MQKYIFFPIQGTIPLLKNANNHHSATEPVRIPYSISSVVFQCFTEELLKKYR